MFKYLLVSLMALSASAFAGEQRGGLVGLPKSGNNVWVEISIPVTENGGFSDRIQDQDTASAGFGFGVGWRPFTKAITENDGALIQLLKSMGLSVDGNTLKGADFPVFLYQTGSITEVGHNDSICYDTNGDWDGTCTPCSGSYSGYCYDTRRNVYGRDTYVKYSTGSVAFGAYLPIEIAQKILVEGGLNLRLHFVSEGIQTDQINHSVATSVGAVIRVAYNVTDKLSVGVKAEKSVLGFDYKSAAILLTFKF